MLTQGRACSYQRWRASHCYGYMFILISILFSLYPLPPDCISYALVQATVGVGTVIIVYIGVAYTGRGGYFDRGSGAASSW